MKIRDMNRYIHHILKEEISRVIRETEELGVSNSSQVSNAINDSDADTDENGSRKFSTSVSNLNNNNSSSKGDTIAVKASNSTNAQSQVQNMRNKYPDFFSNPSNRVEVDVNAKYN